MMLLRFAQKCTSLALHGLPPRLNSVEGQQAVRRKDRDTCEGLLMGQRSIINIIVLGGSNVGKTSLIHRFVWGDFTPERRITLGVDFETKAITVADTPVIVQIWDTAGQERHQGVIPSSFFRTADGCLLVYDVAAKESWTQLLKWRDELLNKLPVAMKEEFPITVIGNKIDEQPEGGSGVDLDEVTKWCQGYQYAHLQTSAREDIGVAVAVQAIAKLALETKALREERLRSYSKSSSSHRYVDFNSVPQREMPPKSCC